jgi:hypothetical protein
MTWTTIRAIIEQCDAASVMMDRKDQPLKSAISRLPDEAFNPDVGSAQFPIACCATIWMRTATAIGM